MRVAGAAAASLDTCANGWMMMLSDVEGGGDSDCRDDKETTVTLQRRLIELMMKAGDS